MNEAAETTEAQPGPIDTTEQAYLLIRQCLEHEPADSRGIIFASKEAVDIIAAAGGKVGQQLRGSPQGLLVATGAKLKIGDWTMTSVYERPATHDEARAEFDRILAAMATKRSEPEAVEESTEASAVPESDPPAVSA